MNDQERFDDVKCPSCGRYVGPYEICPYCQASLDKRVSIKIIKKTAVWGTILGLILLWFGVRYHDVPRVHIGAVNLQYNMAVARMEGTVVDIKINSATDSFRIRIDDGTGTATLSGYGKLAAFQRVLKDRFPCVGDRISAVGNISVSESWGVTLFLSSPRRVRLLERKPVEVISLSEVTMDRVGDTGLFTGRIQDIRVFRKGRALTLSDGSTASVSLVVFDTELSGRSDAVLDAMTHPGAVIRFRGRIDRYRGHVQLRLIDSGAEDGIEVVTPPSGSVSGEQKQ